MTNVFNDIISANLGIQEIISDLSDEFHNTTNNSEITDCSSHYNTLDNTKENCFVKDENFLKYVDEFMEAKENLLQIRENSFSSHLKNLSSNLINSKENDTKMQWCTEVESHLQKIIDNKNIVAWFLQQSTAPNYLVLQHSSHEYLESLIGFVKLMSDCEAQLKMLNDTAYYVLENNESYDTIMCIRESIKKCIINLNKLKEQADVSLKTSKQQLG